MDRIQLVDTLIKNGAVAVIRMADSEKLLKVAEAVHEGGVSGIEITMTTPNALLVIERLKEQGYNILYNKKSEYYWRF